MNCVLYRTVTTVSIYLQVVRKTRDMFDVGEKVNMGKRFKNPRIKGMIPK